EWSPHDFESECLLGSTQIFQRRISNHKCYNGQKFIRPSAKINCPCKANDYECDVGFRRDKQNDGGYKCVSDDEFSGPPKSDQLDCKPGKMFNKTKGYRKVSGDTCEGGEEIWFEPEVIPCPF